MSKKPEVVPNMDLSTLLDSERAASKELDEKLERLKPRRELSKRLVRMRHKAGLSQKKLAELMGREQAFISRLESVSGPVPNQETITRYANACDFIGSLVFVHRKNNDSEMQVLQMGSDQMDKIRLEEVLNDHSHIIAMD